MDRAQGAVTVSPSCRRPSRGAAIAAGLALLTTGGAVGSWYGLTGSGGGPRHRSLAEFVRAHPSLAFEIRSPSGVVLRKGVYRVDETVVVPEGSVVTIEPGTVLRFGEGRSLLSYSPIVALGTEREPIVFSAQTRFVPWGVVGVIDSGRSVFDHVYIERGSTASIDGTELLGSLSVIRTDATVTNSEFVELVGKDALYVQRGRVLIEGNVFRDARRDCLDLDGASGTIRGNRFFDCGDEGIDLGDSEDVVVAGNTILDARGGSISADVRLAEIKARNTLGYHRNDRG